MSTIGNRIYLQAIDDGTQLHGALISIKGLTQAIYGVSGTTSAGYGSCVPDWKNDHAKRPTIYVSLNDRDKYVGNKIPWGDKDGSRWFYNGRELLFSESVSHEDGYEGYECVGYKDLSGDTNAQQSTEVYGKFLKTHYSPYASDKVGDLTGAAPALYIIDNLATKNNVDNDIIGYIGLYREEMSQVDVPVEMNINVRIAQITDGGAWATFFSATRSTQYVGMFEDGGDIVLDEDTDQVWLYPILWKEGAEMQLVNNNGSPLVRMEWSINSVENVAVNPSLPGDTAASGVTYKMQIVNGTYTYSPAIALNRNSITDYGIVEVKFYDSNDSYLCSAFQEIDDRLDDEMMYISMANTKTLDIVQGGTTTESGEGANGSLRRDENASIMSWVASQKNEQNYEIGSGFTHWYIRFLDNYEKVYKGNYETGGGTYAIRPAIGGEQGDGWRPLVVETDNSGRVSGNVVVRYNDVTRMGGKVNGYFLASQDAISGDTV